MIIIEKTPGLFTDDIEFEDLAYRHEDWPAVSFRRSWASGGSNVLIVHSLLIFKFVLNGFELAEITLVHEHGSKVFI